MSAGLIATARADILASITGIAPVYSVMPATLTPPAIIVAEGSPFTERGDTPGSHRIRFELQVFAKHSNDPATALANLDALVDKLLAHLDTDIVEVSAYQTAQLADSQPRIAARLSSSHIYTLN